MLVHIVSFNTDQKCVYSSLHTAKLPVFSPQSKAFESFCSRDAVSLHKLYSDPSFLTSCDMWKSEEEFLHILLTEV